MSVICNFIQIQFNLMMIDFNHDHFSTAVPLCLNDHFPSTLHYKSGNLDDWTLDGGKSGQLNFGLFDRLTIIQMDDYPADSCVINPMAFLLMFENKL